MAPMLSRGAVGLGRWRTFGGYKPGAGSTGTGAAGGVTVEEGGFEPGTTRESAGVGRRDMLSGAVLSRWAKGAGDGERCMLRGPVGRGGAFIALWTEL